MVLLHRATVLTESISTARVTVAGHSDHQSQSVLAEATDKAHTAYETTKHCVYAHINSSPSQYSQFSTEQAYTHGQTPTDHGHAKGNPSRFT